MSSTTIERTLSKTKTRLTRNKHVRRVVRQRKRVLKSLALLFILGALYYLPNFYPFIQNDILAPPPPLHTYTRIDLPYYLTKPERNSWAGVFVTLKTITDFIVGEPIEFIVIANMPNSLTANSPAGIGIAPDDALYYPVATIPNTAAAFPAFVPMRAGKPNIQFGGFTLWSGSETIEYTVTGSFGLTLVFFNYTGGNGTIIQSNPIGNLHTPPLFSIASQDSFVLKRSQSLTMTLTFLLLFFVVLDLIRIEKKADYSKNQDKNSRVKQ